MLYYSVVLLISVGASFFSGLLGIGGGIILIPSYLYIFPALGLDTFQMSVITGITAVQTVSGGCFAFLNHNKIQPLDKKIAFELAIYSIPAAFCGTIVAKFLTDKQLMLVYLLILTFAALSTFIPEQEAAEDLIDYNPPNKFFINSITFISTAVSSAMGFGGAVNFIPIINCFYKRPIKKTITTVTFLVLLTSFVTFVIKFSLGLVPYKLIILIVLGSAVGANLGTKVNTSLSPSKLKIILFLVIIVIWMRIFLTYIE